MLSAEPAHNVSLAQPGGHNNTEHERLDVEDLQPDAPLSLGQDKYEFSISLDHKDVSLVVAIFSQFQCYCSSTPVNETGQQAAWIQHANTYFANFHDTVSHQVWFPWLSFYGETMAGGCCNIPFDTLQSSMSLLLVGSAAISYLPHFVLLAAGLLLMQSRSEDIR